MKVSIHAFADLDVDGWRIHLQSDSYATGSGAGGEIILE
jgi:hypothetical protein